MNIEPIWQEYHTVLHRFIQSRVGDVATTDDILQEVFIKIHICLNQDSQDSQDFQDETQIVLILS
jgi:DNA-directed RNA polymerase specialized sigma24 family protein